jgi:hypothetical protein
VRAYDSEGNIFSSLDGFHFDWEVLSGSEFLRRIPLKDQAHIKTHGL